MPEFNHDEWSSVKGEKRFPLTPRHMVDLWVSCTKTVKVFGVREKKATLLKAGTEFRFRNQLKNFDQLLIEGTGQTPFGLKAIMSPLQNGEYNSGEKAPFVELPEPSNLVLKMRQMSAAHHAQNRMPVLEPEDGPSFNRYEFDDEFELDFEEEAYEKHLAKKKEDAEKAKQEAEAKARKEAEVKAAQTKEPPKDQEPPQGGAHDPGSGQLPGEPIAAE